MIHSFCLEGRKGVGKISLTVNTAVLSWERMTWAKTDTYESVRFAWDCGWGVAHILGTGEIGHEGKEVDWGKILKDLTLLSATPGSQQVDELLRCVVSKSKVVMTGDKFCFRMLNDNKHDSTLYE